MLLFIRWILGLEEPETYNWDELMAAARAKGPVNPVTHCYCEPHPDWGDSCQCD